MVDEVVITVTECRTVENTAISHPSHLNAMTGTSVEPHGSLGGTCKNAFFNCLVRWSRKWSVWSLSVCCCCGTGTGRGGAFSGVFLFLPVSYARQCIIDPEVISQTDPDLYQSLVEEGILEGETHVHRL